MNSRSVLLTGVTGYVGKAILYELLSPLKESMNCEDKVFVVIRESRKMTAQERYERQVQGDKIFADFPTDIWNNVVLVESTGLNHPNCGFSSETLMTLKSGMITHVIHCAADVRFDRELSMAAASNITAALEMQRLATSFGQPCQSMTFVSTAFVDPKESSPENPIREDLVDLGEYDPLALYESMRGDQALATKARDEFGFKNNYVFTKCVAEKLLAARSVNSGCKLIIARPAIVGPAYASPYPGWNGHRPSTITAMIMLYCTLPLTVVIASQYALPVIPVDTVAQKVVQESLECHSDRGAVTVRNLAVDHHSADAQLPSSMSLTVDSGRFFMDAGDVNILRVCAALIVTRFAMAIPIFLPLMIEIFNKLWLRFFIVCQKLSEFCGVSVFKGFPAQDILKYVCIFDGYIPFVMNGFYFEGLETPAKFFDSKSYTASTLSATKDFLTKYKGKRSDA